jgi:hypothetical protein
MLSRRTLHLAALAVLLGGCFPRATVPDEDRRKTEMELSGQKRYLRVAMWSGPFFGDHTKQLLSDQPFAELQLLEAPNGQPIPPPQADRVIPPGTPVRIREVEFPTGWLIAKRVVMTPRYHPWLYLEVIGEDKRYVIVLPQEASSYEQIRSEVDRFLASDDPSHDLEALPAPQRDAVRKKELVEGMSPQALEMAWGFPERKHIDRPAHTEEWSWAEGKRKAVLQDDKLAKWEPK